VDLVANEATASSFSLFGMVMSAGMSCCSLWWLAVASTTGECEFFINANSI
jgi:hypothetical protein